MDGTADQTGDEKSKASLRPVAPAAVSARARVAPPDPNKIPLEPSPEERAAEAAAKAAAEAAEATDRAARERAMREQQEREQAARDQAARDQAAREQAARDHAAREQAMREQAARERATREQAAREQAAREQAAREQAAREQAAREQAAREQAMRQQAAWDEAARVAHEQALRDQAAYEQALREQAAREHAMREQAAQVAAAQAAAQRAADLTGPDQSARDQVPRAGRPDGAAAGVPALEKRRRSLRIAVVAGVAVVLMIVGGIFAAGLFSGGTKPDMATAPVFGVAGAVLPDGASGMPTPKPGALAAAMAKPLSDSHLGTHVSVQVTDMATGTVLFGKNQNSPTTPASTLKLATGLAVLSLRGPNYRITTTVVSGDKPGQVVLIGSGDPTLAATSVASYPESGRLSDLAAQVKEALGGVKPTKVIFDDSLFSGPTSGPGWDPEDVHSSYATSIVPLMADGGRIDTTEIDTKRFDAPDIAAAQTFAKYLGLPPSAVSKGKAPAAATGAGSADTPGSVLGSVQSAPLVRIIETMLANSDNMLAELMARQVAIAMGKPASFAGAAAAVTTQLTNLGMPMQGVHIVDGSGLSPQNKLTPALLSAVLRYAAAEAHPDVHGLLTGMPVAGWSGTLAGRFTRPGTTAGQGLIRAKTGTLDNVSALAGTMIDASGRTLVFVILLDNAPGGVSVTRAIDKLGATVQSCGCG